MFTFTDAMPYHPTWPPRRGWPGNVRNPGRTGAGIDGGDAVVPNALLSIDQNRNTVVERVVREWGDALAASDAGITVEQLRATLNGMRADYLLAASVAGSLDGLRKVVASSLVGSAPAVAKVNAKILGDTTDDLVYTPVVPCRILDTRNFGGTFGNGRRATTTLSDQRHFCDAGRARRAIAGSPPILLRWRSI
jgi:hypothetical protein